MLAIGLRDGPSDGSMKQAFFFVIYLTGAKNETLLQILKSDILLV
jgi:hypothetical protein